MLHQWFLFNQPMGTTDRPAGTAAFHVLCPQCGMIWARCEPLSPVRTFWTASHQSCPSCSIGSLAGADWMTHPYDPFRLPPALLHRELALASSHPDTYNP